MIKTGTPSEAMPQFGDWIARWDTQQGQYMFDREGRFQLLLDALEAIVGDGPLTVVDLGCGPGSLGVRLIKRFPRMRVVGVDVDPVLLTIGRSAHATQDRLSFVTADLRDPEWLERLDVDHADAAVSSTALHWLPEGEMRRLFRDLAALLRPGGAFIDADHARPGPDEAGLVPAATRMSGMCKNRAGRNEAARAESWNEWWDALRTDPALANLMEARDRLGHSHPHGRHGLNDADQQRLLLGAGFQAADVLWRCGDERILAGLR